MEGHAHTPLIDSLNEKKNIFVLTYILIDSFISVMCLLAMKLVSTFSYFNALTTFISTNCTMNLV